ncbi:hypothetical protein QCA50_004632 [Cerrena zonata]|uniref:CCHC-type domain-containing protein n=1 Tax=Cerrena zonata TaxID=2478898 RepID=A0AAW0GPM3_9APHY
MSIEEDTGTIISSPSSSQISIVTTLPSSPSNSPSGSLVSLPSNSTNHIIQSNHLNQSPTSTNMPALTGIVNLPIPGTKGAPKKFKGKYSEIQKFISHYEKVCTQRSVTDPKEKVENITQYCSRNVREFMEGLPSYSSGEWLKFTQDLLEYFDAERDDKRYRCNDLEAFCLKARKDKTRMRMSRWKDYSREFIRIAGWLVTHKKISANEQALYFWKGIPKSFRAQLESRLLAIDPSHDLETPFEINDIHKLAKSMLQRNRFDHDRLPSDGEDSSTSSDEASESDSNSESSESEEETTTRKSKDKKKKSKKRKTAIRKKDPVPVNETEVKRTSYKLNQDEEMENLIAQMGRMSLTDPSYAILYYRAFRLNPVVADIMTRPVDRPRGSRPGMSNDFIANRSNNNPPARPPPPGGNAFRTFQQEERKCYGCGGSGHGMFSCPEMNDLLRSGSVIRDQAGRYTLPDGAIIRRQSPEETLAAAARRLKPVQANYVSVHQAVIKEKFLDNSEEDYEDFYDDDFSYLATRNSKQTQEARRGFQGVFPPARTKHADEHPRRHIVKQDTHVELPSTGKVTKNPVPVDVNPPAFDPEDVNMFVDDPPNVATARLWPALAGLYRLERISDRFGSQVI